MKQKGWFRRIRCPYCNKKFNTSRLGQKEYNFHIAEKHPEAYGYKVIRKTFFQSLIDDLKAEDISKFNKYETKNNKI